MAGFLTFNYDDLLEVPFQDLLPNCFLLQCCDPEEHPCVPFTDDVGQLYFHRFVGLLWKCKWCSYWCPMMDQRLLEEHLIINCPSYPPLLRASYRQRLFITMEHYDNVFGYRRFQERMQSQRRCTTPIRIEDENEET